MQGKLWPRLPDDDPLRLALAGFNNSFAMYLAARDAYVSAREDANRRRNRVNFDRWAKVQSDLRLTSDGYTAAIADMKADWKALKRLMSEYNQREKL